MECLGIHSPLSNPDPLKDPKKWNRLRIPWFPQCSNVFIWGVPSFCEGLLVECHLLGLGLGRNVEL